MGEAICNGGSTVVLAGVGLAFPQGLHQGRLAGLILGINRHIINPACTTIRCVGAVYGGHRQRDEKRIGGRHYIFGDPGFHNQIQTQVQILRFGLAIGVRQGHGRSPVCGYISFQSILYHRGIGSQRSRQRRNKNIRLVIILGSIQSIPAGVSLGTVFQAQGFQEVSTLNLIQSVQRLHTIGLPGVLYNIRNLQVAELHPFQSIVFHNFVDPVLVSYAGGHIGTVPHAILLAVRQVIFVDGQRSLLGFINDCVAHFGGRNTDGRAEAQYQSQTQGDNFHKLVFHGFKSFHSKTFVFGLYLGSKKARGSLWQNSRMFSWLNFVSFYRI